MDRLFTTGQRLVHSRYAVCRLIGKILLWIPLRAAKRIGDKAEEETLPESWEEQDAQALRERIWEMYKDNK